MIKLQHLSDTQLITETKKLIKSERETSVIILHHLREIHRRRLFSELNFTSMFHYCVKGLGYSESQTQRRLKAAKLLEARPDLEDKITNGQTTIATMAQVQTHFDREKTSPRQKALIISKTIHLSKRECEKKLMELSDVDVPKKAEYTKRESSEHSRLSLNASDSLMKKLERIRNLMGHKDVYTYEKLLEVMADDILKRHDPLLKVTSKKLSNQTADKLTQSLIPGEGAIRKHISDTGKDSEREHIHDTRENIARKHIPAKVRRAVFAKSDHRCARCGSLHALQVDHIQPVCHGGGNDPSNLRILCRTCNQRAAIRKIGGKQMQLYLSPEI